MLLNFPKFPFYKYDMTEDIPTINTQQTYDDLLSRFPVQLISSRGFFQIYAVDEKYVRPLIYIPDVVEASLPALLDGKSFRSAFLEDNFTPDINIGPTPAVSYTRNSSWDYHISLDLNGTTKPFLIVLAEDYHNDWTLSLPPGSAINVQHVRANGYANGWIVYPGSPGYDKIEGSITQSFHKYFQLGFYISLITFIIIGLFILWVIIF